MRVALGVDIGSSSVKVLAVDKTGATIAAAKREYTTRSPRKGWVEVDPEHWYKASTEAIRACVEGHGLGPECVVGLAVDGPAHSVALLDNSFAPVRMSLHWADLRAKGICEQLTVDGRAALVEQTTLQRIHPSWTLPQLLWLKANEPDEWSRVARVLATKDYVRHRLVGGYVTDGYDAVGTMLYDPLLRQWSEELLGMLNWSADQMPSVCGSSEVAGYIQRESAEDTGLAVGTPVLVGMSDTLAEADSVGVRVDGEHFFKLATSGTVGVIAQRPAVRRGALIYPAFEDGQWINCAVTNNGATPLPWFIRRVLGSHVEPTEVLEMACTSRPGASGVVFVPFLNGERSPYWDASLEGGFFGLTASTAPEDLARAVVEGVVYSLRDAQGVVADLFGGTPSHLIGGGAASDLWAQLIADVTGQPVVRHSAFSSAVGSAGLVWQSVLRDSDGNAGEWVQPTAGEVFSPSRDSAGYQDHFRRYKAAVVAAAQFAAGSDGGSSTPGADS